MDNLISSIIQNGGVFKNLEVKVFGGGRVIDVSSDVGGDNIKFVKEYLKEKNLSIAAKDLGGDYPRKIIYTPGDGRVKMSKLHSAYHGYVAEEEKEVLQDTLND